MSKLPVLIPIEAQKHVIKPEPTNSKRAPSTKSPKSPQSAKIPKSANSPKISKPTVEITTVTESNESCRDGSPMSHTDLTFDFPYQFVPDSAVNLFPDLNLDNMIVGECPAEIPSLADIAPDKTGWSTLPDLLSLDVDDWDDEHDEFPEFNW